MQTNVNVLFYQANSLLEEHLFSFIGSLTFEVRCIYSLMEVIVEAKAILNVPYLMLKVLMIMNIFNIINGKILNFLT